MIEKMMGEQNVAGSVNQTAKRRTTMTVGEEW
jgi:hypothetical protein